MTQQPNEQQDALVTLVAKAMYEANDFQRSVSSFTWASDFSARREYFLAQAQAALAAVREGHVLIPKAELSGMLKLAMDESNQRIEQMNRDSKIDPVRLLERYMEPHGRAGGGT